VSLKFASLGSGSSGNATIVAVDDCAVLIDCGFSVKETEARLTRLDFDPKNISGILLTHEHGDHAKGVRALSRKYRIPVYTSKGTAIEADLLKLDYLQLVVPEHVFQVGALCIKSVTVPHDAREPLQFVISASGLRVGVLTDLGS
jgi:phosphoribosyl 1,2-cyclic phosphodiesterase